MAMGGRRVAIVGAGWAGLAAAVEAVRAGHTVTLFEAARTLGGRARTLRMAGTGGAFLDLDNGQHILIGAYRATLDLMRQVGVDPAQVLHPMRLSLRTPEGEGITLPALPAPLDALAGVLGARGWSWRDRFSLISALLGWRRRGFQAADPQSVADLCRGLRPKVVSELIEPLCVSALNTPLAEASAQVFLRVLRDALLGAGWGAWGPSWLLLPRAPLGELLPQAAAQWLERRGATLRSGHRVSLLVRGPKDWLVDGDAFDDVVLACASWDATRLLEDNALPLEGWKAAAGNLRHEAIATVYASSRRRLPAPMLTLRSSAQAPAQFVFDRGQLGGPEGLMAFVVSASQGDREGIEQAVMQQAQALGWTDVRPLRTVVERRATFACTPGLQRPSMALADGLWAAGDWVEGPYPATLEGAVLSGQRVAAAISAAHRTVR